MEGGERYSKGNFRSDKPIKKIMVATSWWPVLVVEYCTGKQRGSCRSRLSIPIAL
jgi:hypothetical protein